MSENKNAKRCGAEQLIAILAHGRMESEARDYIQHVLGNPSPAGYSQGDDILGELEGVDECLAYIRKIWKQVGTADGLVFQLQAQLAADENAEPSEEPPNEELEDIPVDVPKDSYVMKESPEEDPGQPDSFKRAKPKPNNKGKRVR